MFLPLQGRYADGRQARLFDITVSHAGDALVIAAADTVLARWPCKDVRLLSAAAEGAGVLLGLADGSLARLRLPGTALESIREICPALKQGTPASRRAGRQILFWGASAIAGLALTFLVLLPWAGATIAEFVPPEYEQRIGRQVMRTAVATFEARNAKICRSTEADAAIAQLVDILTRGQPSRLPLEVSIIDDPMVNAFALPGGQLVIMHGLLAFVGSDAELAAVLAHEISHVDARDNLAGAIRASAGGLLIGFVFGDVMGGIGAASVANYLLTAGYTRELESEADRAAARRLQRAGINPAVANAFFQRIAQHEGDIPVLLRTHPPSPERTAIYADSGQLSRALLTGNELRSLRDACHRP